MMNVLTTINTFKDNFLFSSKAETVKTHSFEVESSVTIPSDYSGFLTDSFKPGPYSSGTTWYRTSFLDYLSNQGGLVISILGIASILMRGY